VCEGLEERKGEPEGNERVPKIEEAVSAPGESSAPEPKKKEWARNKRGADGPSQSSTEVKRRSAPEH